MMTALASYFGMLPWHFSAVVVVCVAGVVFRKIPTLSVVYFLFFMASQLSVSRYTDGGWYVAAMFGEASIAVSAFVFGGTVGRWIAQCSVLNFAIWLCCYCAFYSPAFMASFNFIWLAQLGEFFQLFALVIFGTPIIDVITKKYGAHIRLEQQKDDELWRQMHQYI